MPDITCALPGCGKQKHKQPRAIRLNTSGLFFCCRDHRIQYDTTCGAPRRKVKA